MCHVKGTPMNEIYICIASSLRDAGLPASTFIVEQYLSRNDFQGLMSLLRKAQEKCTLATIMSEPIRVAG
jgi:hypothetical protein